MLLPHDFVMTGDAKLFIFKCNNWPYSNLIGVRETQVMNKGQFDCEGFSRED